jgi:hypothetical protein
MIIAELSGKVSENCPAPERWEDVLTSNVFQLMRYLKPEFGIIPFLNQTLENSNIPSRLDPKRDWKAEYYFWPLGMKKGREPDLVIYLKSENINYLFTIEAKYHSGTSDTEMEIDGKHIIMSQLADEYMDLLERRYRYRGEKITFDVKLDNCFLLFLTKDNIKPQEDLDYALEQFSCGNPKKRREAARHIIWANWTSIWKLLKKSRMDEFPYNKIINDLVLLFERKGLKEFTGFTIDSWDEKYKSFYTRLLFKIPVRKFDEADAKFYNYIYFNNLDKNFLDTFSKGPKFHKEKR